jgi:microcystin-dependent protein
MKISWKTLLRALVVVVLAGTFRTTGVSPAQASCGYQPFVGQVCTFAFNFCPRGFALAAGQLLPLSQNVALFALLGTFYGGDGRTTFALPDLRGRTAVGVSVSSNPGTTGGDATTVSLRIDNSSGGVPVPATQSPFLGLTRCIALQGVFPPRP